MTEKHTPGPWEAHVSGLIRRCFDDIAAPIAEMKMPYRHGISYVKGEREHWHNARLIAAAPELLEALRSMDALFSHLSSDCTQHNAVDRARAAIAKATGGTAYEATSDGISHEAR